MSRREELRSLTSDFLDAFNTNDLDRVMFHFAPDGVYEEFHGAVNEGVDAVRAAFEPQFGGRWGEMKFLDEDLFIDADTGKVLAQWRCTLDVKGEPSSWRGLDIIHWEGDKIVRKLTYAKSEAPLFEPRP